MSGEVCGDNRFELIEKAKQDFLNNTNISEEEKKVLDTMCFRMWQLDLLKKYDSTYPDRVNELKDELDVLNMRYLSQVSMYKSLYDTAKKRVETLETELVEQNEGFDRICEYMHNNGLIEWCEKHCGSNCPTTRCVKKFINLKYNFIDGIEEL